MAVNLGNAGKRCVCCGAVVPKLGYTSPATGDLCPSCTKKRCNTYCSGGVIFPNASVYGIISDNAWAVAPRDGLAHKDVMDHMGACGMASLIERNRNLIFKMGTFRLSELGRSTDGSWPVNIPEITEYARLAPAREHRLVGYIRYDGHLTGEKHENAHGMLVVVGDEPEDPRTRFSGFKPSALYTLIETNAGAELQFSVTIRREQ